MSNFKNFLYLIIFMIDLRLSSTFFDHQSYYNTLQLPVVMISKKKFDGLLDETMVQYGSVIHHKYVLTFAEILKRNQPKDLLVRIDCYSDWYIFLRSCFINHEVSHFKFITNYHPNSTEIKSKYGIIVVKGSILLSPKVNVVRLPISSDIIDTSNCLIYSYIHHEYMNNFVSYVTPIRVEKKDGVYLPKSIRMTNRLIDDNNRELELHRIVSEVSFYGSPIVCALENSTYYVLVGISNLKITFSASLALIPLKVNPYISQTSINFSPEEMRKIREFIAIHLPTTYSVIGILS